VPAIVPNTVVMREAALRGFSTATDLADYLVRLGLPFRDAHEVVGNAVSHGIAAGQDLAEMELATLQGFCDQINEDVFDVLTVEGSVAARHHLGGTAPDQVAAAAERALGIVAKRAAN
jgi:argininosuccinate lyase